MSKVYVEKVQARRYRALQNGKQIATGTTQQAVAKRAHKIRPNDPVLLERVRNTASGGRDKWRHGFKGNKKK